MKVNSKSNLIVYKCKLDMAIDLDSEGLNANTSARLTNGEESPTFGAISKTTT